MGSTTSITCTNCGLIKNIPTSEYTRQMRLNPRRNWFCSSHCCGEYNTKINTVNCICPTCGKEFTKTLTEDKTYCSKSCANIARFSTEEARLKGLEVRRQRAKEGLYVITDEVREKRSKGIKKALQRKPIWNKGLTKDTDDRVANLYKNRRKHVYTEEELHNISKITKDTFWWNNGIIQVRCKICPKGFERGMLKRKKH